MANIITGEKEFFKGIDQIHYEGPESNSKNCKTVCKARYISNWKLRCLFTYNWVNPGPTTTLNVAATNGYEMN